MYVLRVVNNSGSNVTLTHSNVVIQAAEHAIFPADRCVWNIVETVHNDGKGNVVEYGITAASYVAAGGSDELNFTGAEIEFGTLGRSGNFVRIH